MVQITFILRYKSYYGENLYLSGNLPELGKSGKAPLPLTYTPDGWKATVTTHSNEFCYSYLLKNQEGQIRREELHFRKVTVPAGKYKHIVIYDRFEEGRQEERTLKSKVFSNCLLKREGHQVELKGRKIPISFNINYSNLPVNQQISIIGNSSEIGNWNEENAVQMTCYDYPNFCTVTDASKIKFPLEYKYVITGNTTGKVEIWESGDNNYLSLTEANADFIVVNDGKPRFARRDFRGAGVAVPVFSLRTEDSFGVGEFNDIKKLADWAQLTGQRIIQLLPINDTTTNHTWKDSYPYSAISVFALHPMYLNLEKMGKLPDAKKYLQLKKELNAEKTVDYERVNQLKQEIVQQMFERDGEKTLNSKDYLTFYENNKSWLEAYAVFCHLRDKYKTCDYSRWEKDAQYNESRIHDYCNPQNAEYNQVALHLFVQYHLDKQLKDAVAYAHQQGVALKGDLPIGVNRCSVEVWMNSRLFDCNGQAGAPPDDFSKTGQNWGFPIYNWQEMQKDNYGWWGKRLKKMQEYFDAYRIDHILGFFRIFRIPQECTNGLLGQFCPALSLSHEEVEAFGIEYDEKFCEPYISDTYLPLLFGKKTQHVIDNYLIAKGDHLYKLKKQVTTQREIDTHLIGNDQNDEQIREGLKLLTCQVLFVKDINDPHRVHPRIAMDQSYVYKNLPQDQKEALSKLYNDYFYHRNDDFWEKSAKSKLPALLESSQMMVCGEDLGMVPNCVHPVMDELQILSLEIQRMPKEYGVEFGNLNKTPYLSVCTSSSHDMSTMRQWWEENRERTQRYYNNVLHEYGAAPLTCEPWICKKIIEMHLNSDAMWVILPLQDWLALDGEMRNADAECERINVPANPNNYWHYRMHKNLEELIAAQKLNNTIKNLITYYKR